MARTQRQLKVLQRANPLVATTLVGLSSWQSEQQRTQEVARGGLQRLSGAVPAPSPAVTSAVAAGTLALLAGRRRRAAARRDRDQIEYVEVLEVDLVDLEGQDQAASQGFTPYPRHLGPLDALTVSGRAPAAPRGPSRPPECSSAPA